MVPPMFGRATITSASVKDWCKSPHGITGSPDQSSQNWGNKCRLARPQTMPNLVTLWQKECEISAVGTCAPWKSGPKFTKIPQDMLHTNTLMLPNLVSLRQKNVRDTYCGNFQLPGKVRQSSPNSVSKFGLARPLTVPNFVTIWQKVCKISTVKNLCARKSEPKFTKTQMPIIMPNFITLGQTMFEESVTIF